MDRAVNALTYRVFGREEERRAAYEESLTAYERAAVKANLYTASLPPLYRVLSMIGAALILYFGGKNVLGTGWTVWSIAEFTTFLACFTKLATKSSKAAKLFNAVHKAQVSWKRIQPLMREIPAVPAVSTGRVERLEIRDLTCGYPGDTPLFSGLDLTACRGQIIGVTGPVACGKSTLGKAFLCEQPYGGSIRLDGRELAELPQWERTGLVGYLGHDPELFSGTIRENVLLGDTGDPMDYLRAVCLDGEVAAMTEGLETRVGTGGVRLSGGRPAAGAGPDAGPSKTPADSGRSLFGAGPGHGDGDLRPSAASGGGQRGNSDLPPAVSVPGAGSGDLAGKRGGQGGDPRGIGGEYPGLRGAV